MTHSREPILVNRPKLTSLGKFTSLFNGFGKRYIRQRGIRLKRYLSSWSLGIYNVLMPSSPIHDQPFSISTNQDITEFNLAPNGGQSINSSPTTLHINSSTISSFCSYTHNFIDSIWYKNV
jgi:hypothetical protein